MFHRLIITVRRGRELSPSPTPSPPANYSNGSPRLINDTRTSCSIHRGSPVISVEISARMCRAIYPTRERHLRVEKSFFYLPILSRCIIYTDFSNQRSSRDRPSVCRLFSQRLALIVNQTRRSLFTVARRRMQRPTSHVQASCYRESCRCAYILLGAGAE